MAVYRLLLVAFLYMSLPGCAAHTNLEPNGKGALSVNASVGGPVVSAFGTKLPVPYGTLGFNYGITDHFDLNGNAHILPIAYGIVGFDIGTTWYPVLQEGRIPTIGIQPRVMILSSVKSGVANRLKAYPLLSASSAWKMGSGLVYTGLDSTVPFTSPEYDTDSPPVIFSPFAGYRWKIGQRTYLITELKWHAVNVRSDQLAVEYLSIASHGAFTPLFAITRGW